VVDTKLTVALAAAEREHGVGSLRQTVAWIVRVGAGNTNSCLWSEVHATSWHGVNWDSGFGAECHFIVVSAWARRLLLMVLDSHFGSESILGSAQCLSSELDGLILARVRLAVSWCVQKARCTIVFSHLRSGERFVM
jgi:hypothetical protein